MPRGVYKRTPEHGAAISRAKTGVPLSPEHCTKMSEASRNSEAVKAANDAKRGISLSPEHIAAVKKGLKNSEAVKAKAEAQRGVPRSPEVCAKISATKTGIPHSPEHGAAISARKKDVPLSPKHIAALEHNWESMRGGNDICKHHYIYDHNDLSKYTMKMTRSAHARLHWLMRKSGIIVPHINVKVI